MTGTKGLFSSCAKHSAKVLLILTLLIHSHAAFALAPGKLSANVFDTLVFTPQKSRVALATNIYKTNFRKAAPAAAMAALDKLNALALGLHDKPLQCAVFDMRADYYSVNRGYNQLSTAYYQQAINFATVNSLQFERGLYLHKMGLYYSTYKHNVQACSYFLRSQEVFNQVGYAHVPGIGIYLSQVADFYYGLDDYDNAKQNLESALLYVPDGNRDKVNIINTIGLIYRNTRQFPRAVAWFRQALNMAVANKDTVWIGIAKGNIGSVYFLQGQYKKALPYIETDYTTSLKYGEPVNGAIALLRLVKINISNKQFKLADKQLGQVSLLISNTKEDVLPLWVSYYDLKSDLYEQLGKTKASITYRKKYELVEDSILKRNNIAAVERVKLRWEIDTRSTQLNKLEANEKIKSVEVDASIAVLLLLVVISLLVYNHLRLKSKKDKELLLAEKRVVDEELKNAINSLNLFTENLRQKNALIENFRQEIDRLNKLSANKTDALHLEKLLQAHIMTEDKWNDFRKLFSRVYPGFFVKLNKNYSHLSATDIRILALIKLGLNNSEMANMLGITVDGIKKAKQRLRKKIGIDDLGDI